MGQSKVNDLDVGVWHSLVSQHDVLWLNGKQNVTHTMPNPDGIKNSPNVFRQGATESGNCVSHLEVKVGNVLSVHKAHSHEDLLQELYGLLLRQALLLCYEIKQLPATDTRAEREREEGGQ
jgi:hypothetical protein